MKELREWCAVDQDRKRMVQGTVRPTAREAMEADRNLHIVPVIVTTAHDI